MSNLIKDTTMQERIAIVKQWEEVGGCEDTGFDLMEYFRDYIAGKKEIAEINMEYRTGYISDLPEETGTSCVM